MNGGVARLVDAVRQGFRETPAQLAHLAREAGAAERAIVEAAPEITIIVDSAPTNPVPWAVAFFRTRRRFPSVP